MMKNDSNYGNFTMFPKPYANGSTDLNSSHLLSNLFLHNVRESYIVNISASSFELSFHRCENKSQKNHRHLLNDDCS